jgi:hypothetical protein
MDPEKAMQVRAITPSNAGHYVWGKTAMAYRSRARYGTKPRAFTRNL